MNYANSCSPRLFVDSSISSYNLSILKAQFIPLCESPSWYPPEAAAEARLRPPWMRYQQKSTDINNLSSKLKKEKMKKKTREEERTPSQDTYWTKRPRDRFAIWDVFPSSSASAGGNHRFESMVELKEKGKLCTEGRRRWREGKLYTKVFAVLFLKLCYGQS